MRLSIACVVLNEYVLLSVIFLGIQRLVRLEGSTKTVHVTDVVIVVSSKTKTNGVLCF